MNNIKGIIAYPITPFTKEDNVDISLFKHLLERLIASGAHAVAPLGSTGVLPYLSDEEKEAVVEAAIKQVSGRVPLIAGVSCLTTERTIYHAGFAEKAGADAVMILPMSYWKLSDDEIFDHYEKVASAISVPIMAYNNPATGGIDMSPALLKRLLEISNVTMIKESTGDVQRMQALRKALGDEVAFYNGSNTLALAAFAAGAKGWCTAAPNLIPELNLELYNFISQNNYPAAREVFYQQLPFLQALVAGGIPRVIAAGLNIIGVDSGFLRAPLQPLPNEQVKKLAQVLTEMKGATVE